MFWPPSSSLPFPYPQCLVTKNLSVIYFAMTFFHLFVGLSERFKLLCIFEYINLCYFTSTQWISFSISYKAESGGNELPQLFFVQESLYFLKVTFTGFGILDWGSFSFKIFQTMSSPSLLAQFLLRSLPIVLQVSLLCIFSYFSFLF